jgi:NADH dehydrogenase (ubiquinone) 1 alpha subcomplex subunit 4
MEGAGSRSENNRPIQGMSLKSLKKHTALQPLFVIMGLGMTFVVAYCIRLASRTTDVAWRKQAEPYDFYRDKQFKFMNIANRDFSTACQAPKYKEDTKSE